MSRRPPLTSRQTTTTLSDASHGTSLFSSYHSPGTTALTSPDLSSPRSPKKAWLQTTGRMDQMLTVLEGASEETTPQPGSVQLARLDIGQRPGATPLQKAEGGSRRASANLGRGPSVKDRANAWETTSQAGPSTSSPLSPTRSRRPLPQPSPHRKTSTPIRSVSSNKPDPSTSTPTPVRRVPVPYTAPIQRAAHLYDEPEDMTSLSAHKLTPPELRRGTGSAKRMIRQWETQPGDGSPTKRQPTSATRPLQAARRVYSQEYLNAKPLPVPSATPLPTSNYYSPAKPSYASPQRLGTAGSPSRIPNPSPLKNHHLQTPHRDDSSYARSTSPSSQNSLPPSPSSGKRKGKSPLKDMLNLWGGGIKDVGRKMKGKSKDRFGRGRDSTGGVGSSREDLHFWEEPSRIGSAGLPGGIVFSDRMGDNEMVSRNEDPTVSIARQSVINKQVIRTSPVVYLIPTPCSSVSPWGSWFTSYASLTSTQLRITYCPVFGGPQSGISTPKRILSGSNPLSHAPPAVAFSAIPLPDPGQEPDVELSMKDCCEVRSLRRDEVKGRGIPVAPEGIGTEVLEMVWSDGSKRYLGVEGVGGRLGWVSAIWDVLLACKSQAPPILPPPSPLATATRGMALSRQSTHEISPLGSIAFTTRNAPPELAAFRTRIASLEQKASPPPNSSAPPVQKVGDTWVAASALGPSDVGIDMERQASADALRDSVQRMFDLGPTTLPELVPQQAVPTRRESQASDPMERVKAWQQPTPPPPDSPTTEHLSIFRNKSQKGIPVVIPVSEIGRGTRTDTILSFDPNDLNPSRSASQVRRATTILGGGEEPVRRYGPKPHLAGIEEASDTTGGLMKPPTHISHVTFPKPSVGGYSMAQMRALSPHPEMYESEHSGSTNDNHHLPSSSASTTGSATLQTPQTMNIDRHSAVSSMTSLDHTVLAKLDDQTATQGKMVRQIDEVQGDVQKVMGALTNLVITGGLEDLGSVTKGIEGKLDGMAMDVKAIENALNLSSLASRGPPSLMGSLEELHTKEEMVPELHRKLDAISDLCEQLLSRSSAMSAAEAAGAVVASGAAGLAGGKAMAKSASTPMAKQGSLGISIDEAEEKEAGKEVAAIMADLTGGSSKTSPRMGGIQVLHSSADGAVSSPPPTGGDIPEATRTQIQEVLTMVKDLKDARSLQTQQTTDIARYLNELNSWLEKFVLNSTKEMTALNNRLTSLVGPDPPAAGAEVDPNAPPPPLGLPDLVADMHCMISEQKRRADAEGLVGQRLDTLLQMMGAEQERHASQQTTVEQVIGALERQRQDNEILLRALATDLTSEIRGERIRFVEAMQQATSVNVNLHVEEFKKLLGAEVAKSMAELGQMREEKKALEQNISDLFALKAKHGSNTRSNTKRGAAPPSPSPGAAQAIGRGLPATPSGRSH